MGFLLDKLDQAKFVAQRDIVQNERRQGVDNQPYGRANEIIAAALYPASNPYSWDVIGSMADLSAASEEDVKSFFRQYYSPSNATIAIVGDFQPAQARALVRKYFADLRNQLAAVVLDLPAHARLEVGEREVDAGRRQDEVDDPVAVELGDQETPEVIASASAAPKCERCWHYRDDVGNDRARPELCGRCVENVNGAGETRRYF